MKLNALLRVSRRWPLLDRRRLLALATQIAIFAHLSAELIQVCLQNLGEANHVATHETHK